MNRSSYKGFTLLEMILVIIILSVLSVLVAPLLQTGFDNYFTQRNLVDANWQGQLAMERIAMDIQGIPQPANISVMLPNQLSFYDANTQTVTYSLTTNQLLRSNRVLADGINSIAFTYYDRTGAITTITANVCYIGVLLNITKNNTNMTLQTLLYIRNAK